MATSGRMGTRPNDAADAETAARQAKLPGHSPFPLMINAILATGASEDDDSADDEKGSLSALALVRVRSKADSRATDTSRSIEAHVTAHSAALSGPVPASRGEMTYHLEDGILFGTVQYSIYCTVLCSVYLYHVVLETIPVYLFSMRQLCSYVNRNVQLPAHIHTPHTIDRTYLYLHTKRKSISL